MVVVFSERALDESNSKNEESEAPAKSFKNFTEWKRKRLQETLIGIGFVNDKIFDKHAIVADIGLTSAHTSHIGRKTCSRKTQIIICTKTTHRSLKVRTCCSELLNEEMWIHCRSDHHETWMLKTLINVNHSYQGAPLLLNLLMGWTFADICQRYREKSFEYFSALLELRWGRTISSLWSNLHT